jgi:heme/copper-type cytochrome/quinol oxidase subunit 1
MAFAAAPLAMVPVLYALWPVGHPMHFAAFAQLMQYGHLCLLPLGALLLPTLPGVWRAAASPERAALLASLLLFSAGGVLAFMIRGINVVVPAHYHGSIVGVTLAFMGLTFGLLPQLGWRQPLPRWARWQPLVYGGGQLMHILGLAWSGGYGVQRKVAGTQQVLSSLPEKIGMGMMGLGGLIAIIGGLMFVLACLMVMRHRPLSGAAPSNAAPSTRAN